jgi:ectoine hydroxylase-related dioxygenase (phytanoyl-CoA dioxygenase family)
LTTSDASLAGLAERGYVVIEDAVGPTVLAAARDALDRLLAATPHGRNDFEGFDTRRVYGLLAKTRALDPLVLHPVVLEVCDRLLQDYLLSAAVAIEIGPGETAQTIHHDDAVYPLPRPHPEVLVSTMWAFDDFVPENGATVVLPGSHRWDSVAIPEGTEAGSIEMPAGSVAIYLGALLHGGGANTTAHTRLGLTIEYVAAWLRQQENMVLVVPPDLAASVPERVQQLLGYSIAPPFMGYVDGLHPRRVIEGRRVG